YQGSLGFGGVAVGRVETDALVAFGGRNDPARRPVTIAETTGNAGDFIPAALAPPDLATKARERLLEETANVVGLEAPSFRSFHLFSDLGDGARIKPLQGELTLADQLLNLVLIDDAIDGCKQSLLVLRIVAVQHGIHQQFA